MQDPLQERATLLFRAARVNAVAMLGPLQERFPILYEIDRKHWDFILTIAQVFEAASRLANLRVGDAREEKLMQIVTSDLSEWDPDGVRGFDDCKSFSDSEFDRLTAAGHEPSFVASDGVGKWIIWNVLGRAPQTTEEAMLVRATGAMVTHAFFDWWDA